MSKRKLPQAKVAGRPGVRTEITEKVLSRWNPGIQSMAEGENTATISILEQIGEDWFGDGVTAKRIAGALRAIGDVDVVVTINSPGGDFFEGLAIYNLLREHPAHVTVKIIGMAASAASVIAMAGDDIQIARAAFLMIHNTWVVAGGDRHALREVADWLEPFDGAAIDIYAARTGTDEKDLANMLDRETWIGGSAAVDQGFADNLLASDEVTNSASNSARNGPVLAQHKIDALLAKAGSSRTERRQLIAALKGGTPGAAPTGTPSAAVEKEVRDLLTKLKSM